VTSSPRALTLGSLAAMLGAATAKVVTAPAGLDGPVAGPCLYDAEDPAALGRDEVVLAVNVNADDLPRLCAAAAAAGSAAVAVRESVAASAAQLRPAVAVLAVPEAVTWDQFLTVVRNAVAGANTAGDDDAPIGDLFALADAVAALVGGAVTIEDANSNLLAYSNLDQPVDEPRLQTILGRRLPDPWADRLRDGGFFEQLLASPQRVIRIQDPRQVVHSRLATTIRAGSEVLGYLWALEGETSVGPETEAALFEASRVAALHILKHRASDDLNRRERGSLLQDLLEGRKGAREVAARLGIAADAPCAVVAFRLVIDDDVELTVKRARTIDLITVACQAFRRRVAIAAVGQTVYALFPSLDARGSQRLLSLVRGIAEQSRDALTERLLLGIGGTVPSLELADRSRDEADRAVRVLIARADPQQTVASIDDVRASSVVLAVAEFLEEHDELRLPALDLLAIEDEKHNKSYLSTLKAFVSSTYDVGLTAERLGLHPNSVRYRLRRIESITGLNLGNVDVLVGVTLQLALSDRVGRGRLAVRTMTP
jgi:sugar diacid utilization regulator